MIFFFPNIIGHTIVTNSTERSFCNVVCVEVQTFSEVDGVEMIGLGNNLIV